MSVLTILKYSVSLLLCAACADSVLGADSLRLTQRYAWVGGLLMTCVADDVYYTRMSAC
jgi:hypothetical protein